MSVSIMTNFNKYICVCLWISLSFLHVNAKEPKLLILTVATDGTDGFFRFMKSANQFEHDVEVLGMGRKWEGGDIVRFPGGGQKILILREAMEKYKDREDLIVMFTDSYDVVLAGGPEKILETFKYFEARMVFAAESFCWPDRTLEDRYPTVKKFEKRYLNSGGFMGYAPDIYKLINHGFVEKTSDDQLYYTEIFLDIKLRKQFSMKLDTRSEIFQCLNGALDEVDVKFKGDETYLHNMVTGNAPLVLHGNGPILMEFNYLTNYVPNQWNPEYGCMTCEDNSIILEGVKDDDLPQIYVAVFIERPTAFLQEFLDGLGSIIYPKSKIDLFLHYTDDLHADEVQMFILSQGTEYNSASVYAPKHQLGEWDARQKAMQECVKLNCKYYFNIDGSVHLEFNHILHQLVERNRSVIAPAMHRPGKMWANFWGALNSDGFYKRSDDYVSLVEGTRLGLWNVPHISACYLIHGYVLPNILNNFFDYGMDPEMAFSKILRNLGIFMYIDNQVAYGFLSNSDSYTTNHKHNDLYSYYDNRELWEKKYIHEEYHQILTPDYKVEEPCPDVFWLPFFTTTFCNHLIEEMEFFGEWSGGKHQDARLQGGYENVPTDDIHTNQIGWEDHWLSILKDYIVPVNGKMYMGYYSEGKATMNFVVKYHPERQAFLRPHSDSSTYTVNVALNRPHIDYEGGGVRFLRYNCNVTNMRVGWLLMHPGRLTHEHEGLQTTNGTRYIMVSFIDP